MIKPYYQDDAVTIYHGDCREIVPQLGRFDLLLTDPPYGINLDTNNRRFTGGKFGKKRGSGSGSGERIFGDDQPFDPFPFLHCASKKIIWGWNNFADKLPRGSALIWIKRLDKSFGSFLSDAEIAWYSSGCGVYCFRDISNQSLAAGGLRVHPTQKPLGLMIWCIQKAGNVLTILDPFAGSGTTGRAAKDLGRKCTLIEREERYCEIAASRMAQEVFQLEYRDNNRI